MTRNGRNRPVFPLVPTARGYTKLAEYFAKNGDLEFLATQSGCYEVSGVKMVSVSHREIRQNRMNIIESDVANLKYAFASYLTNAVNMFSGCDVVDTKMRMGFG